MAAFRRVVIVATFVAVAVMTARGILYAHAMLVSAEPAANSANKASAFGVGLNWYPNYT